MFDASYRSAQQSSSPLSSALTRLLNLEFGVALIMHEVYAVYKVSLCVKNFFNYWTLQVHVLDCRHIV